MGGANQKNPLKRNFGSIPGEREASPTIPEAPKKEPLKARPKSSKKYRRASSFFSFPRTFPRPYQKRNTPNLPCQWAANFFTDFLLMTSGSGALTRVKGRREKRSPIIKERSLGFILGIKLLPGGDIPGALALNQNVSLVS